MTCPRFRADFHPVGYDMPEIQARLGGEVLGEGHGYGVGIGAGEDGDSGGITTPSIKKPLAQGQGLLSFS